MSRQILIRDLFISGNDVPKVVEDFVERCNGNGQNKKPDYVPRGNKYWCEHDYRLVARFINPERIGWRKKKIIKAFEICCRRNQLASPDYGLDTIKDMLANNNWGPKTPNNVNNLDLVELYNAGLHLGLHFDVDDDLATIYTRVKFATMPIGWIKLLAISRSYQDVVNAYPDPNRIPSSEFSHSKLAKINPSPFPTSPEQAIVSMAKERNLDITHSHNPLVEYYLELGSTQAIKRILEINKYRLDIGTYFNLRLPYEFYTPKAIGRLGELDSIMNFDPKITYNELRVLYLENSFHHLLQPEVIEEYTSIYSFPLQPLIDKNQSSEIVNTEIICYGTLSYTQEFHEYMKAFTIRELVDNFIHYEELVDPFEKELFSDHSIIKLKNICIRIANTEAKILNRVRADAKELSALISSILIKRKGLDESIINWTEKAKNNQLCMDTLYALLDIGMYLRSWKGPPNPYPIKLDRNGNNIFDIKILPNREIEDNYFKSSLRFWELDQQLDDDLKISKLPIYIYRNEKYERVKDSSFHGNTIADRLDIVNKGDFTSMMSSCVRLSSNWFLSSVCYYLSMLGNRPDSLNIEFLEFAA